MTTLVAGGAWVRFDGVRIDACGTGLPPASASAATHASTHDQTTELGDALLFPGFVDLQVNGVGAVDFATARDARAIAGALDTMTAHGTTACLPTIVTAALDDYDTMLDRIRAARDLDDAAARCTILGVHLEGPFLGGAPGAHPKHLLRPVEIDWLAALLDRHSDLVRMVTLAPEADPDLAATRLLHERGVIVALGHSTCSYAEAVRAADAGARAVTHLFNGMRAMHHRDPGLAEAALVDDRLTPSVIADLHHVSAASLRLALAAKERVVLVTDAVAPAAGTSGGLEIVERDGAVYLPDGTLAGSVIHMDDAVRNVARLAIPMERVARLAATNACEVLGDPTRGRIEPGRRADLVAIDPTSLSVVGVWLAGAHVA